MNQLGSARQFVFHPSWKPILSSGIARISSRGKPCTAQPRWGSQISTCSPIRSLHAREEEVVSFRKQFKDAAKRRKAGLRNGERPSDTGKSRPSADWELTVGIEIHAELSTTNKLFSSAATSVVDEPNSHVALFDVAFPGSQPGFQKETLLPALRAAIALDCKIQRKSSFDRKHYFYQDQPAGYQITQYYEPFARDGHITLYPHDGIAAEDAPSVTVGIKQIQMEQDTAKTLHQPPSTFLLDFNRVSHPLVEIISIPVIHHPATAAAYVRKVQSILRSVNACTAGMELGGLRADVNVSVRRKGSTTTMSGTQSNQSYAGFTGLGQRTEIKNLSSFKAVEDAIVAERDRQISLLERGGVIEGETRGFAIGSSETRKLRGKEGEIDYRYMPDPDIAPLVIAEDLIDHLRGSLPALPDQAVDRLVEQGVLLKDAKTLNGLEEGERLEYFYSTLNLLRVELAAGQASPSAQEKAPGKIVANWVIHELGSLLTNSSREFDPGLVPPQQLAQIIACLLRNVITGDTARSLFSRIYHSDAPLPPVTQIIDDEGLRLQPLSAELYKQLAESLISENPQMVKAIKEKSQVGKVMWFVGQMMRSTKEGQDGRLEAKKAETTIRRLLEI